MPLGGCNLFSALSRILDRFSLKLKSLKDRQVHHFEFVLINVGVFGIELHGIIILRLIRFHFLTQVPPKHREFSMGVTSMADSCGIALAGATALPTHNALCTYWRNKIRS